MKVLVCDDEPLAADRLVRMLNDIPDVEVAGTYLTGEDLLARASGHAADVLLLDVDMPELDGFDVIDALARRQAPAVAHAPLVIFVTAHAQFALEAFDTGAIDFLTKPVRLSRLERAMERARTAIQNREAQERLEEISKQLHALRLTAAQAREVPHLWLRKGSQLLRVEVPTIDWIAAEGECVRFHCGPASYLDRQSISGVERKLASFGFVRIHRSKIVNVNSIQSLSRSRWGAIQLRLNDGSELRVSKTFQSTVNQLVGRSAGSPTN